MGKIFPMDAISVKEVLDKPEQNDFLNLPFKIYPKNSPWVSPLLIETRKIFSSKYPFRKHGEMKFYLAYHNGNPAGRIAVIIDNDFIEKWKQRIGHFGFFECVNDIEVAKALFQKAEKYLKDKNISSIQGPMNPSTHYTCGMLVNSFELSPCLDMPYNPPYYADFLEQLEYKKKCDLYAYLYLPENKMQSRLETLGNYISNKNNISVRAINFKDFSKELKILREIYNDAWDDNFGFVPVSEEEFSFICGQMKDAAIPDLILIAYIENEPAGFIAALPDYNIFLKKLRGKLGLKGLYYFLLKRKSIKATRVITFGIKKKFRKKGADISLLHHLMINWKKYKFQEAELSWILEHNEQMIREIEKFGGKHYKTYRIYEKVFFKKV